MLISARESPLTFQTRKSTALHQHFTINYVCDKLFFQYSNWNGIIDRQTRHRFVAVFPSRSRGVQLALWVKSLALKKTPQCYMFYCCYTGRRERKWSSLNWFVNIFLTLSSIYNIKNLVAVSLQWQKLSRTKIFPTLRYWALIGLFGHSTFFFLHLISCIRGLWGGQ